MADYKDLLAQIDANIRRNGAQEITGPILNAVLRLMVSELGSGAVLMGVATPDTRPGTPDGRQAWLAAPGNYPGFGEEVTVPDGTIGVISNASGSWTVQSISVGRDYSTEIKSLQDKVGNADFSETNYLTKQTDLTGAAKTLDVQVKLAMDDIDTLGASEKNIVNNLLPKKQNATDSSLETESKTVVGAINEVRGEVETLQESSTPAYVLNGLCMALSMGGMHLDDATPYIGSFEELAAAVKNKARIVDYTFVERGTRGDQTMVISVGNANLIEGKTINIVFDLGQGFCEVLITKTDDGCSATGKLIPLAATNVNVTLSSAYTIPANPSDTEYIYYITVGATTYPVTGAEGIVWQDGTPPEVETNSTLVVSVINNLAVWGTFKEGES